MQVSNVLNRKLSDLGSHDLAVHTLSHQGYNLYIKDNTLHLASCVDVRTPNSVWVELSIPAYNAKWCAIELDGYWAKLGDKQILVSTGYPYMFWVRPDGYLYAQRYNSSEAPRQMAGDVVMCMAIRGYGSTEELEKDQGIVLAYLKDDGSAYYKNFARDADGNSSWSGENGIPFPAPLKSLSAFRGVDYNINFVGATDDTMYMTPTSRVWTSMAVPKERVKVAGMSASIALHDVTYHDLYARDVERVTASVSASVCLDTPIIPAILEVEVLDKYRLRCKFNGRVLDDLTQYLEVVGTGATVRYTSFTTTDDREFILTTTTHQGALGLTEATIKQQANKTLKVYNVCHGYTKSDLSKTFVPKDLSIKGYETEHVTATPSAVVTLHAVTYKSAYAQDVERVRVASMSATIVMKDIDGNPV